MRDKDNLVLAALAGAAMMLSFVWFDLPGHGSAFADHATQIGFQFADGHTLFLIGMFVIVALEALFPHFFERHETAMLVASAVIGTPALAVYCTSTSLAAAAVSIVLIGFSNLVLLTACFHILAYVIDRAVLACAVVLVFAVKTFVVYLANRFLGPAGQMLFVVPLPVVSLAFALAARARITPGIREANAVRIKFEEPLSTVMMGMVLISSVLFATTRVVSNMGFWGTDYAVARLSVPGVLGVSALFALVCYVTIVRARAQLLFRFMPGLFLLFVVYAFLYSDLGVRLGFSDLALSVLAQYAELYGETFVWTIMFLAMRTLHMPSFRVVGLQFTVFTAIELAMQQYVRHSAAASLVIVLIAFFVMFALLIWALWHFYGTGRFDQGPRCEKCIHAAELERLRVQVASASAPAEADGEPECVVAPGATTLSMASGGAGSEITDARRQFAERHGLSERETDVFVLLAQGRSRRFICDELFIADGTASTHIRHVYEKLGVHSKQELLSLVLDEESEA